MYWGWSLKSSMVLICTSNIMCDVFVGMYLMLVPSSNFIILIWFVRRVVLALLIGFSYP